MHRSLNPAAVSRHGNLASTAATHAALVGLAIDDVVYHLAHDYPGGVPALATRMAMSPNSLAHKVSLTQRTHHLSPSELVKLQAMAGDARPLVAMAAALGYVAMPVLPDGAQRPMEDVARAVREFGEMLSAAADAASDGRVSVNEMQRVEREAGEVILAINGLLGGLRAMMPASTVEGA